VARAWRLTSRAEKSLQDIAAWTVDNFGPQQAKAYEDSLVKQCEAIASGPAHPRSCRKVIDSSLPDELHFIRSGMHLMVFVDLGPEIVIADFLHVQRDLPRRLTDVARRQS
jgi:plasmid stabilization system protein ParE